MRAQSGKMASSLSVMKFSGRCCPDLKISKQTHVKWGRVPKLYNLPLRQGHKQHTACVLLQVKIERERLLAERRYCANDVQRNAFFINLLKWKTLDRIGE